MRKFRRTNVVLMAVVALAGLSLSAGAAQGQERDVTRFSNKLLGSNEVPPADGDGQGRARVQLHANADQNQVCFDVQFRDIGTPNRGHIHAGAAGVNGGIRVTFFELRVNQTPPEPGAPATDPRNDLLEKGGLEGCVTVTDQVLLADIAANPANYYVNLHNARYPGGAVRCQLV